MSSHKENKEVHHHIDEMGIEDGCMTFNDAYKLNDKIS